jgi:hypothetical protein
MAVDVELGALVSSLGDEQRVGDAIAAAARGHAAVDRDQAVVEETAVPVAVGAKPCEAGGRRLAGRRHVGNRPIRSS